MDEYPEPDERLGLELPKYDDLVADVPLDPQGCPARTGSDPWNEDTCGRPIKRDGLCGIHAAAADKIRKNDAARDEKRAAWYALCEEVAGWDVGAYIPDRDRLDMVSLPLAELRKLVDRG